MASFREPRPRWGHVSATVEGKIYVYGGCDKYLVHCFDPLLESWAVHTSWSEYTPKGIYTAACALSGPYLYLYGGGDGSKYYNSLHQLDTKTWNWRELSYNGPMRKGGCGMVAYNSEDLVLFGGVGVPPGPPQPGAEFVNAGYPDRRRLNNEIHIFNLNKGEKLERCSLVSLPTPTYNCIPTCMRLAIKTRQVAWWPRAFSTAPSCNSYM